MSFPITLTPSSPAGLDSPRLGDDEIRNLKSLLADLFTLPVSPSTISATIGSVSTGGKLTITNGVWTGDVVGRAYGGTGLSVAGTSGNLLTSDGTNWTSAAPPVVNHAILSATHTDSTAAAVVRGDLMVGIGVTPKWERVAKGAEGTIVRAGATEPAYTTATYPDTTTINQLLYSSSANVLAGLATGNSGVLITSGAGVPSIGTDIPTAVTIGGAYAYRANGTDVAVADGGTSLSTLTLHALQVGNGTSAPTQLGLGTTTTVLHGAAAGDPTWAAVSLTADVSGILPTANGGTGIAYFTAAGPTAARVYTFPDVAGSVPLLGSANVFTAGQTISNTAPSLVLTDTTASAKSLTVAVDANVADLRESAGASGSLLALDLANARVSIGTSSPSGAGLLNLNPVPSVNWTISGANPLSTITIADNGTYDLATGSGMVMLHITLDSLIIFLAHQGFTSILADPGGFGSISGGTALKINFYYNAGTGKYRIENKRGGSRDIYITTIMTRPAS